MLVEDFDLLKLKSAEYNPRVIDDVTLSELSDSIKLLGTVKPILANSKNNTIVAGHQRTKAHILQGLLHAPVYLIKNLNTHDEVRFNQLHNATDIDDIDNIPIVRLDSSLPNNKFIEINPNLVDGDFKSSGLAIRSEICRLLARYGNWGSSVITNAGEVITSPHYLLACKQLSMKPRVYVVPDDKIDLAKYYLNKTYGKFSYDNIYKETWLQSHAQMTRLTGEDKQFGSVLYNDVVLKSLDKLARILDFGCGKGDYVKKLKNEGYRILGVEFYPRVQNELDKNTLSNYLIDLYFSLSRHGRFDVTVCDSVLNSVDSLAAQHNVLVTINALTKKLRVWYTSVVVEESTQINN